MRRWGIALVVALVLLLLFGGMGSGVFFVLTMAAVVLIAFGGILSRDKPTSEGRRSVVEREGTSWTRGANGAFLRWNTDAQRWEDALPPPAVIRSLDVGGVPPPSRNGFVLGIMAVVVVVGLMLWALVNPYANIPGISKIVCSLKGAIWEEGSAAFGVRPGCYGADS